MSQILNLKSKIFFLGIITTVLVVPIFAHGAGTEWSEDNNHCFVNINYQEKKSTRQCFADDKTCQREAEKAKESDDGIPILFGGDMGQVAYTNPDSYRKITSCNQFSDSAQLDRFQEGMTTWTLKGEEEIIAEKNNTTVCSLWDFDLVVCLKTGLAWGMSIILWLLVWILWLSAQLFNLSIQISISNFSSLANSEAIKTIWGLGRDLANICFIFILMYIAIATIIQKIGNQTRELVVQLIITALLINFSIIIPKVIIDIGNSLAVVFYNQLATPGVTGAPDIVTILVKGVGPEKFFASKLAPAPETTTHGATPAPEPKKINIGQLSWSTIVLKGLSGLVLILVLSYALFVASFVFLARTVVLIFLIATSSLAFFSKIIPSKNLNYWETWFNTLIKEVMFAPFFLFLFYLVLLLADTNPFPGTTDDSTVVAFIWPLILCGLAIGTTIIAKKASTWSGNVGNKMATYTGTKLKGAGGLAARNTLGRAANKIANSERMKSLTTRAPMVGGLAKAGLGKASNAKFGGQHSYETAQKARADKMKKDMEGMTNEQKATYMKNLSSGTWYNAGVDSRSVLYQHGLSEEERTKIEGGAESLVKDEADKAGEKAYKEALVVNPGNIVTAETARKNAKDNYISTNMSKRTAFITSQRSNLRGEEKIKTYTQRIRGVKTGADKLKLLGELTGNEKELKAVIKELDENSLAKISTDGAFATANQTIKNAVNDKVSDYDAEASEKFDKAVKKESENKAKGDKKDKINELMYSLGTATAPAGWAPTATPVDIIKSLDKQSLGFLNKDTIKKISTNNNLLREIGINMGVGGVAKLINHTELADSDAQAIGEAFQRFGNPVILSATGTPTVEPELKKISDWLNHQNNLMNIISKRGS